MSVLGNVAGMAGGAAFSATAKKAELVARKQGRTAEQRDVLDYFYASGGCGCMSKAFGGLTDEKYEELVRRKATEADFKRVALARIGVDESQVQEIAPINFEGYYISNTIGRDTKRGKDNIWRSSGYQITWLFFGNEEIYIYQHTFDMTEETKSDRVLEYSYKDITSFSTKWETEEVYVQSGSGCLGQPTYIRQGVETRTFHITVPGDEFRCTINQKGDQEDALKGMINKFREKKAL